MNPESGIGSKFILIDNNILYFENINLGYEQEIKYISPLIQGGDMTQIGSISYRVIKGQISFPLIINDEEIIPQSIINIFECAQKPRTNTLKLQCKGIYFNTNNITDECDNFIFNDNSILGLDCWIEKLSISAKSENNININIDIICESTIDEIETFNNVEHYIYRALNFNDFFGYNKDQDLNDIIDCSIEIENRIKPIVTITGFNSIRKDTPTFFSLNERIWSCQYTEVYHQDNTIFNHGGWYKGINLNLLFGKLKCQIPNALFETSKQEIDKNLFRKTTKLYNNNVANFSGSLFYFN